MSAQPSQLQPQLLCVGCGYDLRGSMASDKCPECGRAVFDAMLPLARPDRVARAVRRIGNSYLGMLALVPTVTGSCMTWVGLAVLGLTGLVRLLETIELRFRADAGKLPVVGTRVGHLWVAVVAEMALLPTWAGLWLLARQGQTAGTGGTFAAMALLGFGAWLVTTIVGAALAGRVGEGIIVQLGNASVRRLLRTQVQLALGTAAATVGIAVLAALIAAANPSIGLVVGGLGIAGLSLAGVVLIFVTMAGMSQLSAACDRARAAAMDAGHVPQVLDHDFKEEDLDLEEDERAA